MAEIQSPPQTFADIANQSLEHQIPEGKTADDLTAADIHPTSRESDPPPRKLDTQEAKTDTKAADRRVPDELFGGKKTDTKEVQTEAEPESEISKIPDPEFKDKTRKAQWDTLKTKALEAEKREREQSKKASELEKKIAEYEAKGKDSEGLQQKLADLEKKHEESMKLVHAVNAELDPEYQAKYVQGRQKLIDNARSIIEESGGNPDDIATALNLKGKSRVDALREAAGELDNFQAGRLGRVIDALNELDSEASTVKSDPKTFIETRQKQETERITRERETQIQTANKAYAAAEQRLSSELEVLKDVKDIPSWNEQGKEIRKMANEIYFTKANDPEVAAETCIRAASMEVYRQLFVTERAESQKRDAENAKKIDEMAAELKKIYGTTPSVKGGNTSSKSGVPTTMTEKYEELMRG